jgi:hypothetical protein
MREMVCWRATHGELQINGYYHVTADGVDSEEVKREILRMLREIFTPAIKLQIQFDQWMDLE